MSDLDTAGSDAAAVLAAIASRSAAQSGSENFPVALKFLPRQPRTALTRVYAFSRFVDDVGDEAPGNRRALLDLIDSDVRLLPSGQAVLAPVAALRPVVVAYQIPVQTLLDLVEANRVDQERSSYDSFDALLGYCRLSAAPIGRMVLHVAGAADDANIAASDAVCAGLQVLEHCQDVGEDAHAGRVYLPAEDLLAAGVDSAALLASTTSPQLRRVIAQQTDRAFDLLKPGTALINRLSGWARIAVSGYVAGGLATAYALRSAEHDVLGQQVIPSRLRTAGYALRLLARR